MYLTAVDATLIMTMQFDFTMLCSYKSYKLLTWTLFFKANHIAYYRTVRILSMAQFLQSVLAFCMSFFLNAALCLDLILVLKDPFKSCEKRAPYYLLGSFAISVTFVISLLVGSFVLDEGHFNILREVEQSFVILAFVLAAIVSAIYAFTKLSRPGISP